MSSSPAAAAAAAVDAVVHSRRFWHLRLLDISDPAKPPTVVREMYYRHYRDAQNRVSDYFRELVEEHDGFLAMADIDDPLKQLIIDILDDGTMAASVREKFRRDLPVLQQLMSRLCIRRSYVIDPKQVR